jgi:hypothetical protein
MGKDPRRFPMPVWLLARFAGADVIRMWRWLRSARPEVDRAETRALLPQALGVEAWLRAQRGASSPDPAPAS